MRNSILIGAFASLAVAGAASAQSCGPREHIVSLLQDTHQEVPHGAGLAGDASMVEVFKSNDSGTWTVIITRASGVSCVIAAGTDWLDPMPMPVEKAGIAG